MVRYNASVESSMKGYIKESFGPSITVQYNGAVEDLSKSTVRGVWGTP
jgi:hypothetical protein